MCHDGASWGVGGGRRSAVGGRRSAVGGRRGKRPRSRRCSRGTRMMGF
ncbi:AraC family transcriptional regulator [Streptomyces scabiei]|nr:AraC family transcriptional regulator [Streptomyces sp. LBUM 1477]MBP5903410.1 AraC family transcriptional regulator [Streptomyces sp. LBUM 1488]QTU49509.1 AraC family transcriptional regulator [Streptomyces sp. LBUM 1482]QTU65733.1 AraC family transcriptional regulator [Streptomyces sp. LBUM 1475]